MILLLVKNNSQQISANAPTVIPAIAPAKLKRFQNRLRIMEGPIAAPNKPQALETSPMIEADSGLAAISRAMTAMRH